MFFNGKKTVLTATALLLVIAGIAFLGKGKNDDAIPQVVDFNYDVRPILVQKCYLCHGPDPSSRKADLRLDTYEGATALTKEGLRAIDPKHTEKSLVLFRINHKDPDIIMPTPESNLTLTERERKLIEKWIDQGAAYKPHWAFIPEKLNAEVKNYKGNPIDYFINKKLDEKGLDAVDEADKNSLIRRAAYLLTGLPPTEKELDQFLSDRSDDAYEKMVDRYLASPAFGERWARHWMDVVRYAETRGHEFDYPITGAWRYRDYLVRAFNQDLPYNKFVTEHLAGDILEKPRTTSDGTISESRLATMYFTMAEGTHSPVDIRKDEADRIDNMIDVTSKAFQALTVSCTRCHDHKFDPISAKDYYSLYGVMEGTRFTPVPANQELAGKKAAELRQLKDSVRTAVWNYLLERSGEAVNNKPSFASLKNEDPPPSLEKIGQDSSKLILADFSGQDLQGWKTEGLAFTSTTTLGEPLISEQRKLIGLQEGLASSRKLATGIFGALRSPDFIINNNFIGVLAAGNKSSIRIIIDNFQLISWPIYGSMDQKINTEKLSKFIFDVGQWKGHKAYVEILPGSYENHVFKMAKDAFIDVKYVIAYNKEWFEPEQIAHSRSLGESLIALTQGKARDADLKKLNSVLRSGKAIAQSPQLINWLSELDNRRTSFTDSIEFYSGVTDGYGKNSKLFLRGNHNDLSPEPVKRVFLPVVQVSNSNLDVPGSGRFQLALSVTDPKNPLTSRVMVNRIWHYLFGKGIVETVDNFGMQGKLPSHPELLDFMALQFREDGYSIKKTIRKIMLSDAFKRSTKPDENALKKDPSNIYLSYYPVRRLEAEAIRDAMLSVSGSIDRTMYGAPVPTHITSFMNGRGKPATSGPVDGNKRRSIYLEVRRNFLDPIMAAFDRPTPFTTFGRRTVTNVPSQSLILLNDPFVILMADRMATQLFGLNLTSNNEKIQWIYRRSFSRAATKEELKDAEALMEKLRKTYASKGVINVTEKLIWKDYIHTVFNLKEFIFLN